MNHEWHISCVGPGWQPIVRKLIKDLLDAGWNGELHQVKEKFGTLRFYAGHVPDDIYHLIGAAEQKCAVTCEECGQPGELRGGSWLKTLCDTHDQEREADRVAFMKKVPKDI